MTGHKNLWLPNPLCLNEKQKGDSPKTGNRLSVMRCVIANYMPLY